MTGDKILDRFSPSPVIADLSIVIVNWNTRELLAGCLQSIAHMVRCAREVLVVDNQSPDGSPQMVRDWFPWATVIESPTNLGFAAGNNLALKQVTGRLVLLLNPDTVVKPGSLELLSSVLENASGAGIAGAQLLNGDGSLQKSYAPFPTFWSEVPLVNRLLSPVRRMVQANTEHGLMDLRSVDWVCGACLMIRREVIDAIGPLDESFWLYTEETDWCYRARAAGWEVLSVPQAKVYHLARAASCQRFAATTLHFYQSKVRFALKHHGPAYARSVQRLLHLKASVWRRRPTIAPLRCTTGELSGEQQAATFRMLEESLALPLADYLAQDWRNLKS